MNSDPSEMSTPMKVVLTVLGLWMQVVCFHFFPIPTTLVFMVFATGVAIMARVGTANKLSDPTPLTSLGDRGKARAKMAEEIAATYGTKVYELAVSSKPYNADGTDLVDLNYFPKTNQIVVTRAAYELDDDAFRAFVATEFIFARSMGRFVSIYSIHAKIVLLAVVRLVLISWLAAGLTLGFPEAIFLVAFTWCIHRAFVTSFIPMVHLWAARLDRKLVEKDRTDLKRALHVAKGYLTDNGEVPTKRLRLEHLQFRLKRLESPSR